MINTTRIEYDLKRPATGKYEAYWAVRNTQFIPRELFERPIVNLEIGAGTGAFFSGLAALHPDQTYIAVERCRHRARRLVKKSDRLELSNFFGYRGNAIPALIHGVPTESVDNLYILYPCPWPRISQRKNRWYLHPTLRHFLRILKPEGRLIWASDQKFYIDEAEYVCRETLRMKIQAHGEISPNPWNQLDLFPGGRTKFERTFLASGQPCYELIAEKHSVAPTNSAAHWSS